MTLEQMKARSIEIANVFPSLELVNRPHLAEMIETALMEADHEATQRAAKISDGVDSPVNPPDVRHYASQISERIRKFRKEGCCLGCVGVSSYEAMISGGPDNCQSCGRKM